MSPVVVVDNVPPVAKTGDVDRIRYCGSGMISMVDVLKTQHPVLFVCCVRYEHGKSQEIPIPPDAF